MIFQAGFLYLIQIEIRIVSNKSASEVQGRSLLAFAFAHTAL